VQSDVERRIQHASPSGRELAHALAGLRVERTPDGGVRIEAPRESAVALLTLFEGLTAALREARDREGA
jgi:hypothetical protein